MPGVKVSVANLDELEALNLNVTSSSVAKAKSESTALEASRVIALTGARLYSLFVHNTGPAQFIMLFDSTTVPANGVVTPHVFEIAADTSRSLDFNDDGGLPFATGIVVCNSTTNATKTIGAADCLFVARYA